MNENTKKKNLIYWITAGVILVALIIFLVVKSINNEQNEDDWFTVSELNSSESIEEVESDEVIEEVEFIYVDIKGAVKKPGVYRLDNGSRMLDAIEKAGGLNEDADTKTLNQAQLLEDQMLIYIYTSEEIEENAQNPNDPSTPLAGNTLTPQQMPDSSEEEGIVNINQADQSQLETLPGIGPKKAQAIIDHRETYGSFQSKESIQEVSGIGPKTYENLKDFIRVD